MDQVLSAVREGLSYRIPLGSSASFTVSNALCLVGGIVTALFLIRTALRLLWAIVGPCCRRRHWKKGDWAVITGATDVSIDGRVAGTFRGVLYPAFHTC